MAKDYDTTPRTEIRYRKRAVKDEEWIKDFLRRAAFGVLATVCDGQPFLHTRLYVYDESENAIYLHGARDGRTYHNVNQNEQVCFSISEMGRLTPAEDAENFGVEYAGVVVFGRASIIEDSDRAKRALQLLLDKYFPHLKPGHDYTPSTDDEVSRTAVYRIDIDEWSGKQAKKDDDFPGAYLYGQFPE